MNAIDDNPVRDVRRTLLLCGMRDQPARMMKRAEFHRHIGDENILPSLKAALARVGDMVRRES